MVAVRVYVEGGGDLRRGQRPLRDGFSDLFAKLLGVGSKPKVILCGGRKEALKDFTRAHQRHRGELCMLLVDSEAPVRPDATSWDHVRERPGDGWNRPEGVADEQLHLMVQKMEAWFVADPEALAAYYGQGFRENVLPGQKNVEQIAKADLDGALERATKDAKTKGPYQKSHGFELIGLIDPAKVRKASPHAARFFDKLTAACTRVNAEPQ